VVDARLAAFLLMCVALTLCVYSGWRANSTPIPTTPGHGYSDPSPAPTAPTGVTEVPSVEPVSHARSLEDECAVSGTTRGESPRQLTSSTPSTDTCNAGTQTHIDDYSVVDAPASPTDDSTPLTTAQLHVLHDGQTRASEVMCGQYPVPPYDPCMFDAPALCS
jgi:hypothetical protein